MMAVIFLSSVCLPQQDPITPPSRNHSPSENRVDKSKKDHNSFHKCVWLLLFLQECLFLFSFFYYCSGGHMMDKGKHDVHKNNGAAGIAPKPATPTGPPGGKGVPKPSPLGQYPPYMPPGGSGWTLRTTSNARRITSKAHVGLRYISTDAWIIRFHVTGWR